MNEDSGRNELRESIRGKLMGGAVTLSLIIGLGLGIGLSAASDTNDAARATKEAALVVRTDRWLASNGLDKRRSADMQEALTLACEQIASRGEKC